MQGPREWLSHRSSACGLLKSPVLEAWLLAVEAVEVLCMEEEPPWEQPWAEEEPWMALTEAWVPKLPLDELPLGRSPGQPLKQPQLDLEAVGAVGAVMAKVPWAEGLPCTSQQQETQQPEAASAVTAVTAVTAVLPALGWAQEVPPCSGILLR